MATLPDTPEDKPVPFHADRPRQNIARHWLRAACADEPESETEARRHQALRRWRGLQDDAHPGD